MVLLACAAPVAAQSASIDITIRERSGPGGVPPVEPGWHEPPGFTALLDEGWEDYYTERWDRQHPVPPDGCRSPGIRTMDGKVTWIYEAGRMGGSTPCHIAAIEGRREFSGGPYHYTRQEGVMVSANWQGHQSGVNKIRYFTGAESYRGSQMGITLLAGRGQDDLTLAINASGWDPRMGDFASGRLRWDSPDNLASPTLREARFTRGEPHTIELLLYLGTVDPETGSHRRDGWVKAWLDGALVLHFSGFRGPGEHVDGRMVMGGLHISPVWGGVGDVVEETQILSIDHTYISVAEECPSC